MVLKLVKSQPKCPKCQVPMVSIGHAYSDAQLETLKKQKSCNHKLSENMFHCTKCGHIPGVMMYESSRLYQCPKCFDQYKDDKDEKPKEK